MDISVLIWLESRGIATTWGLWTIFSETRACIRCADGPMCPITAYKLLKAILKEYSTLDEIHFPNYPNSDEKVIAYALERK